jgi:hypothetical protein
MMGTMTYTEKELILGDILLIVSAALLAFSFFLTRFLKSKIVDSTKDKNLIKRLAAYRMHLIISIAFYEMVGFMAGVFMYISGRIELLIVSLAALLLIFMNFPNRMKIKIALKITDRELMEGLD